MALETTGRRITWYRSPVPRHELANLNQRSDWKGLAQTLSHLGLLALSGAAAWIASTSRLWGAFALILLIHGTCWAFLLNGFHELCHKTVFKSKFLNTFFLYLFSFLSWFNPVHFWASHQEHHKYTLHPPDDMEVLLPQTMTLKGFLQNAVVNPWDFIRRLKEYIRWSTGRIQGEWESMIFPASNPGLRRELVNWSRLHLAGHLLLTSGAVALGWWQLPVIVTLAPFYGGWLLYLVNNTQHSGLVDKTPDYRLCCRTIYLNPVVQFLYWHMNYHTEHHMYAAVPCYNLKRLHELIREDLPPSHRGLISVWKEILSIQERQKADPTYQYRQPLPVR
jgi:fatty acid desaturase